MSLLVQLDAGGMTRVRSRSGAVLRGRGLAGGALRAGGPMARDIHCFAYGTLQQGPSYADMGAVLGEPRGRFRTLDRSPSSSRTSRAAPIRGAACCTAWRCWFLTSARCTSRGDVYLVDADGVRVIDRLEIYDGEDVTGPYVRREIDVVSIDGRTQLRAQACACAIRPRGELFRFASRRTRGQK